MIIISILYIGLIIHILYLKINNAKRNNRIYTTSVFLHSHAKMIYIHIYTISKVSITTIFLNSSRYIIKYHIYIGNTISWYMPNIPKRIETICFFSFAKISLIPLFNNCIELKKTNVTTNTLWYRYAYFPYQSFAFSLLSKNSIRFI